MHVAARSNEQAADIYVTWQAAHDLVGRSFSVELAALDGFSRDERLQLEALLADSTEGIACQAQGAGWVIDSDGWASFGEDEALHPCMRIFEMRDPSPIEAFVLAADQDDATELFEEYILANGGDPDTLLWREWRFADLTQPERAAIDAALAINREGLVTCDATGRWAFVIPLG